MRDWLRRINRRRQPVVGGIDQTWSHDGGLGIRGWIIHKKGPLTKAEAEVDGVRVPITNWHPRPDVRELLPELEQEILDRCGFWVHIPRLANHHIALIGTDGRSEGSVSWVCNGARRPSEDADAQAARPLFQKFVDEVNRKHLHVLEIGSRVVAPGSESKRSLFEDAASYTGFDYYSDDNTDIVGDAHRLSDYFGHKKFDAVFSYSVLEHLAMPWVFAVEVNQVTGIEIC